MKQIIFTNRRVIRELHKAAPLEGAGIGHTTVRDGYEEILYEVTVDMDALDSMARVAARNKNGSSNDGPLRVKVTSRRRAQ